MSELKDPSGRLVEYLRISVTDRCNERCLYCMPEGFHDWLPRNEVLSYEELLAVARVGVDLGVRHFRITGGEPLVRKEIDWFIGKLSKLPDVESVQLTTNATRLEGMAEKLHRAGIDKINVNH